MSIKGRLSESTTIGPTRPGNPSGARDTGMYGPNDLIADRYEVREIRRGGMGIVYGCYDHVHQKPVAVKTLKTEFFRRRETYERFLRESYVWVSLGRHPNVVQAFSVNPAEGRPFVVVELIPSVNGTGPDLRSYLRKGALSPTPAVKLALEICRGMIHVQTRFPNLIHRDLKPENVLLTVSGAAKVTDFGLVVGVFDADSERDAALGRDGEGARRATPFLTKYGQVLGTLPYMSPEQCRGGETTTASDIYALGCILYEMCAGRHPFAGETPSQWLKAHVEAIPQSVPNLDEELDNLILKCLAKLVGARYGSWHELASALESLLARLTGQPVESPTATAVDASEALGSALALHSLGRYSEALRQYDHPDIDWNSPLAWNNKGLVLLSLKQASGAAACFGQALHINEAYAYAWNNLGVALAALARLSDAVPCYDKAITIDAAYADAWANRGGDLADLGNVEEGLASCERALSIEPNHTQGLNNKGKILGLQRKFEESLACFRALIELNPWRSSAWVGAAASLGPLGRNEEGLVFADKALEIDPRFVSAWCLKARLLFALGRHAESSSCMASAVAIDGLAAMKDLFGSQVLAAMERPPITGDDWLMRAGLERFHGNLSGSLHALRRALELGTEHEAAVCEEAADVCRALNLGEESIAFADRALAADPNRLQALVVKGATLCDLLDRPADALALFDRAIALEPHHVHAHHNRGAALLKLGRWTDALVSLDRALALDPFHGHAHYNRGHALVELSRVDEAEEAFRRALELGVSTAKVRVQQCRALRRTF